MIHLLDTDVLTIAQLPDSPDYLHLHARVLGMAGDDVLATTIVTYDPRDFRKVPNLRVEDWARP